MKALIIGGAGFVGHHLTAHLREQGWDVAVSKLPREDLELPGCSVYDLDILDPIAVGDLLAAQTPHCVFHLAAQSSVALSWREPGLTVDVNVRGTVNLLEALRRQTYNPRTLLIGSGEEYGYLRPEEIPVEEETALRPGNVYAATKACQGLLGGIYARAYDLDILMARAFNHIGPGQAPSFVVSDFCKQVAEIEAGKRKPVIRVGNLSTRRDFTDVRDIVRAYLQLVEKGQSGDTYNVGSGQAVSVRELLDQILEQSPIQIRVEEDPSRLRPSDVPFIEAGVAKLRAATGWQPNVPMAQTIADTLDWWRNILELDGKLDENI